MSKLDDAVAVVFEERGGQTLVFDEMIIRECVEYHQGLGRKVWVFRKDASWDSKRPSTGLGSTE